jgi:hypothetical protein
MLKKSAMPAKACHTRRAPVPTLRVALSQFSFRDRPRVDPRRNADRAHNQRETANCIARKKDRVFKKNSRRHKNLNQHRSEYPANCPLE